MKNISLKEDNILFEENGKQISRKVKVKNGLTFLNYKKEKYLFHSSFSMGYGSSTRLIKITPELKELEKQLSYSWFSFENILQNLVEEYNYLTTENISVPSGPDSSKFRATKSGFIRVLPRPDTFGSSSYSCGSYFHKGIQIGGNISDAKELIDKIIFIGSLFNGKLNYNNSETKPTFKISLGTNFSTYGIG